MEHVIDGLGVGISWLYLNFIHRYGCNGCSDGQVIKLITHYLEWQLPALQGHIVIEEPAWNGQNVSDMINMFLYTLNFVIYVCASVLIHIYHL